MGVLSDSDGEHYTLGAHCRLGRHATCDLHVDDPKVSAEHASLRWMGDRWELRDLDSRNGTWVAGRRLGAGKRVGLEAGATFALGDRARVFTLVDAGPPIAGARHVATNRVRAAHHGLLVLPSDEEPLVSLFEDTGGLWVVEAESTKRLAVNREVIQVAGEAWVLELPSVALTTIDSSAEPTLESVDLRLAVSRDEEHVEVTVLHEGKSMPLPPRSAQYLLVLLARARLADLAASEAERGWVDRDVICRMLRIEPTRLNVDIFRLRKQLGALGVHGISGLVARRPSTGQLRLGTDRVAVTML